MANVLEYIFNIKGNAVETTSKLKKGMEDLGDETKKTASLFDKLSAVSFGINNIIGTVSSAINTMSQFTEANKAQQEAEAKLAQVMRNTMDATADQVEKIKQLTAAQQALGVVGDEVQLAGAQELSTYLEQTDSLEQLIPVMNDMIAQQYGLNASQESAVGIATMMGKVMEGQVGALSRYGYKFDEAQEKILKYGTEAEKVATLAEVISESVGGMNEALASTPEGKMQQLANNFGDVKEQIGKAFVEITSALMPALQSIVGVLGKVASAIVPVFNFVVDFAPLIIGLASAIGVLTVATNAATIATKIATVATGAWAAVQSVLNVILTANPIGLIIAAIGILIGLVVTIIKKWEEWGAALTLFMGPIGMIISLVQSFRANWESVKQAFQSDGIIAGLKRIGIVMLDALLKPVQQLLEMLSSIPGVGKLAGNGAAKIKSLRDSLGLKDTKSIGTNDSLAAATSTGGATAGKSLASGGSSAADTNAVASGGQRSTSINITIGDMIKEVNFNGTTSENAQDIERTFAECLYRVLGMAQVSV